MVLLRGRRRQVAVLVAGMIAIAGTAFLRMAAAAPALSPRDDGPWSPSGFDKIDPRLPTLFVASDSTAATGNPTARGWGAVLIDYFDTTKLNIVNCAVGGRSFRTFTAEGRWDKIVEHLKPGDFVIIEFGHNDGGGAKAAKGRGDVPGIGEETETVERPDGSSEVVHTFGWYARKYIRDAKAKGATPILSSTTVRNIWKNGGVERGMGKMLLWAKQVADEEGVLFLDHSNIAADAYEALGPEKTAALHPQDHTHTSTAGAQLNAETLIAGLKTLEGQPLVGLLNEKGQAIPAHPRGPKWAGYDVRRARLGIAGAKDPSVGAIVREVQPGTPADKAGIVQGDVITEVAGVAVADFEALMKEIAKAKPGDSVLFKVKRQSQETPIEVTVTFAAWEHEQPTNSQSPTPSTSAPSEGASNAPTSGDANAASSSTIAAASPPRDAPFGFNRRGKPLKYPPGVEPGMQHPEYNAELPTLWLVGDSTVKEGRDTGLNGGRWGWGHEIGRYFDLKKINVENQALGGTSSRSFRTGGMWEQVLEMVKPGDFVMMQFGHNDGGVDSNTPRIRARGTLPGAGDETAEGGDGGGDNGKKETVHTYGWYLRQYVAEVRAAGATPIICSLIPRNNWRDGHVTRGQDDSYVLWAREAAEKEGVAFINLNHIICDQLDAIGEGYAKGAFFRADDGTHTNLLGAQLNAQCVVGGVKALGSSLKLADYLSAVADSVAAATSENVAAPK